MSSLVKCKFILTGALAGKSLRLGKYNFVDGALVLEDTPENIAMHARSLERNWCVYPEGAAGLESKNEQRDLSADSKPDGKQAVSGNGEPNGAGAAAGEGSAVGAGDASANAGKPAVQAGGNGPAPELNQKLARAVAALDPMDDAHWTADGKPAMVAVSQFYGATDITRADVEAAAPGFRRPSVD